MREAPLGDVLEVLIDHRGKTPKKLGGDFQLSGVPVASAVHVKYGRLTLPPDARCVSEAMYRRWMSVPVRAGDVVLTSEAPLGEVALVPTDDPLVLGQRLFGLRGKRGLLDNRYLYYLLQWAPVRSQLLARATGTTVHGIRQSELVRISIPLPSLREQEGIAEVLGALDDKITQNDRVGPIVQDLARSTFEALFERDSRSRMPLGELTTVVDCLHSRKPELVEGSPCRYLVLKDVREDGRLEPTACYTISSEDYAEWTRRIEVRAGDCVITNVGRVGAVAQIPKNVSAAVGRNMTAIRGNVDCPSAFLFELLRCRTVKRDIEANTDHGTVLSALNVRTLPRLLVPASSPRERLAFQERVGPLHDLQDALLKENVQLAALRDALLPPLLSGALPVQAAEALVGDEA